MQSVTIASYSRDWPDHFAKRGAELLAAFAGLAVRLEHIGSTSIPDFVAKPVIDVLLGADSLPAIEMKIEILKRIGHQYVPKYGSEPPVRRSFVKPDQQGALRVHLHAALVKHLNQTGLTNRLGPPSGLRRFP